MSYQRAEHGGNHDYSGVFRTTVRYTRAPSRPTTRATDAAGAAATWVRLFGVIPLRPLFLVTTARSAADASVGRLVHKQYGDGAFAYGLLTSSDDCLGRIQ